MSDTYDYPNEGSAGEEEEEEKTLADKDSWVGVANSTKERFLVKTSIEKPREKAAGGE